jgi:hypothetical protein
MQYNNLVLPLRNYFALASREYVKSLCILLNVC